MWATGHADDQRAADLNEPQPDEPPCAPACNAPTIQRPTRNATTPGNGIISVNVYRQQLHIGDNAFIAL
jgi:hypothetical protein